MRGSKALSTGTLGAADGSVRRGAGSVFYFRPGHETYPTYHDANVQRVIANAVAWAHNPAPRFQVTPERNTSPP